MTCIPKVLCDECKFLVFSVQQSTAFRAGTMLPMLSGRTRQNVSKLSARQVNEMKPLGIVMPTGSKTFYLNEDLSGCQKPPPNRLAKVNILI